MKLGVLAVTWVLAGAPPPSPVPLQPRLARVEVALAPEAVVSRGADPLSIDELARRDAVVAALLDAEAQATESPETAERPLLEALRGFSDVAPLVVDDAPAQQARVFAQLALARTHLVLDRPEQATAALDDALRTARGQSLPIGQFGPAMVALHADRVVALGQLEPATLEVTCSEPCRVLVDERPFDRAHPKLPPGAHRVWVEAVRPGQPVLRRALDLAPGAALELAYAVEAPAPAPELQAEVVPLPRRLLPRWAAGLGIGAGAGMLAVGGALVGVDHRCPDLSDPHTTPCLEILDTDTGGFVLLGVGSAVLVSAVVILVIDEIRARRARESR